MELEENNYKELGLKVGFEIHQELDTKKLFCDCPSDLTDEDPSMIVNRELRPTESELGEIDRAALAEEAKSKRFQYEVHPSSVCLVELDEEPPHPVNNEALNTALEVSLLLNSQPVDEAHIMRKTVIDGSNTAGFQRTILVATDGKIKHGDKEISLPTICLEEDAARKVKEKKDLVRYKLDRLGIPLLEIATGPDFNDPETPAEAALKIGRIIRATGKAKRGIGTIRQDVNVSIKAGARQEIKGVQELSLIPTVIKKEVQRQVRLLEIKKELEKRGHALPEEKIYDVTEIFSETESKIIKKAISDGGVYAIKLDGFDGLLGKELISDHRFGTELSDYAKVYGKVEGIFHTDELPGYGITEKEVNELEKEIEASEEDAIVIIADKKNKAKKALEAIIDRAKKAFEGVPEETRRALPNGHTQYMRPLPGAARMYVETDVPPIQISDEKLKKIKSQLPEKPEDKKKKYQEEYGLSEELATQMSISENASFFEKMVAKDIDPTLVATTLEQTITQIKRSGIETENITYEDLEKVFKLVSEDVISKDALPQVLEKVGKGSPVKKTIDELGIRKMEKEKVKKIVKKIIEKKEDLIQERGENAADALMGLVMAEIGGKADGKLVHKLLLEEIEKRSQ